jgi:hypothetical protein
MSGPTPAPADGADALARARDLARELALARDVARDLARDLDADVVGACARARELVRTLHRVCAPDLGLGNARNLARDLVGVLDSALAGVFDRAERARETRSARAVPERVCRRLVAVAVRALPAAYRPRYAAEFWAELWELAGQQRPRRRQVAYSARLVRRCWALRRSLTAPAGMPARTGSDG